MKCRLIGIPSAIRYLMAHSWILYGGEEWTEHQNATLNAESESAKEATSLSLSRMNTAGNATSHIESPL